MALSSPRPHGGLAALAAAANAYTGSWKNAQLARDVNWFVWETYDPDEAFIYPNVKDWDGLLEATMESGDYSTLTKDEVLSILFGLHHRSRVVDGLWESMLERGVTQKLLGRLLALGSDKYGFIRVNTSLYE